MTAGLKVGGVGLIAVGVGGGIGEMVVVLHGEDALHEVGEFVVGVVGEEGDLAVEDAAHAPVGDEEAFEEQFLGDADGRELGMELGVEGGEPGTRKRVGASSAEGPLGMRRSLVWMPWVRALKRTAALPWGVTGPRERRPLAALVRARRSVGVGWSAMGCLLGMDEMARFARRGSGAGGEA